MNIRAILFDVYGTVLEVGPPPSDADDLWRELFLELFQSEPPFSRLHFSIATSKVIARHHTHARTLGIQHPEVHWPSVVAEVLPPFADLAPPEQEEFLLRQVQTGHTTRMTSETAATLLWLQGRPVRLGIASNAQAYTLRELENALSPHKLGFDLFAPALSFWSFEHGFSKPDPHVFRWLTTRLTTLGVAPHETLMVGDRLDNDILPARAFGWHAWHLGASGDGGWAALRDWLQRSRRHPAKPLTSPIIRP